ncbi:MAG TPA: Mpo1-like protein [Steroidobacteraceae bacterium]|nr:Mpo1-like protein [Steroidobacteraceae bacterium]
MRTAQAWLDEYSESHRNLTNEVLHWICVPAILLSAIGLLSVLPVPAAWHGISLYLNWGSLFVLAGIVYYFLVSIPLALGMIPVMLAMLALVRWLEGFTTPLWIICVAIFVVAWIGQFIGHVVEGKRPSFFKDVQFLMIGPIWLLAHVYRRAGIPF